MYVHTTHVHTYTYICMNIHVPLSVYLLDPDVLLEYGSVQGKGEKGREKEGKRGRA